MADTACTEATQPLLSVSVISPASDGRVATISLAGELDRSNENEARLAVDRAVGCGATTLIVDLSGLTFMDSSGVNMLLRAYHSLMRRHGRLILVASSGPVRRILEVVRLSPLVPIHPTMQQALSDADPAAHSPSPDTSS